MKKYSSLIIVFLMLFVLSSCSQEEEKTIEKQDFIVKTQDFNEFNGKFNLEKIGKVSSRQNILLTSKALGQVASVTVKTGDSVQKGQPLMYIADNISNYGGNLQGASLSIEGAQINYETQEISLDKRIADAKISLERTQKNFEIQKSQIEEDMKKAKIDFDNSSVTGTGSQSSLQLQKIDESIQKAEFDYSNLLVQNQQQINTFISNAKNEYNSLLNLYTDIIEFSDTILGVTSKNKDKNDSFQNFLGAYDQQVLSDARRMFDPLVKKQEELEGVNTSDISEETVLEFLAQFEDGHEGLKVFLNLLEEVLLQSADSVGFDRQGYISQTNGYQTQVQAGNTGFVATKNAIQTFLNTYKLSEESSKKQIELLYTDRTISQNSFGDGEKLGEIAYNKIILSLEDQLSALETGVKNAELAYENALKTKDVTLKSLKNQIANTQNNYSSALKEYNKLIVTSPIDGTISEIFADVGQEVSSATQLFEIVSESIPEIELSFSKEEKAFILQGQDVFIDIDGEIVTGKIYAISEVADQNLNYKATIVFDSKVNIIGNLVSIKIPVVTDTALLPINIITTKGGDEGTVKVFSGSTFSDVRIRIGEIFGEYVEVVSCAQNCDDLNIVVSDISNYDENKFTITEQ